MYQIKAIYRGNRSEEIDTALSEKQAKFLVNEYKLAFGNEWTIWYEKVH